MPYLLDTSFCIELLRQKPAAMRWAEQHPLSDTVVSSVVEMELHIGVLRADNPVSERAKVDGLLAEVPVLPWDSAAARATAEKYHLLAGQGNLMEAADTFIAGHALSLGYTIVTADAHLLKRARAIGLKVEDYRAATG